MRKTIKHRLAAKFSSNHLETDLELLVHTTTIATYIYKLARDFGF